jgi:riboflavin-specific deaminase-like protein
MTDRPYVTLSCAMSIEGYIDDLSENRLLLSNDEDFDRVDAVRSENDAILVGANTIRQDDPRLLIRSHQRQLERQAAGKPSHPMKVTLTTSGNLDPGSRFFTAGDGPKLVYSPSTTVDDLSKACGERATVVDAGNDVDLRFVLEDLSRRGVERLMVEGGGHVHTRFLEGAFADEIHLVVAPFFVGEAQAPRFVHPGAFPQNPGTRMSIAEVRQIGDVVLIRYLVG